MINVLYRSIESVILSRFQGLLTVIASLLPQLLPFIFVFIRLCDYAVRPIF